MIAFATCRVLPEPDDDERPLLNACAVAGLDACMAAWDDPCVDWAGFDLVVLRSTWNYHQDESGFRRWLDHVSKVSRVLNPPELISRTLDKTYLGAMERLGVPIVPTRFAKPGEGLEAILGEERWNDFVLKPTVSCGSFMTRRFSIDELAEAKMFQAEIERERRVIVQKFMPSVQFGGEVSLVHIDGMFTHALVKNPRFLGQDEEVSEAIPATADQQIAASRVLGTVSEPWLYARTDFMADDDGNWLLSECEMIEPSLFFSKYRPALERFVQALGRLV